MRHVDAFPLKEDLKCSGNFHIYIPLRGREMLRHSLSGNTGNVREMFIYIYLPGDEKC